MPRRTCRGSRVLNKRAAGPVLRSSPMKTFAFPALSALALAAACAATAFAQAPGTVTASGTTVLDSGRFVTFSGGTPVATEDFMYEQRHDSLFVTSNVTRHARANDGTVKPYQKSMEMIAKADDAALLLYASTEKFDGNHVNRMVSPAESTVTVTVEKGAYGAADAVVRPPGRISVLDAGVFTLFDVIARNLNGRLFSPRPVGLIVLGDQTVAMETTASPAGRDTLRWGARRVVTERIQLSDSTATFVIWVGRDGHMLRLENARADMVVMREPPALPPASKRRRPHTP